MSLTEAHEVASLSCKAVNKKPEMACTHFPGADTLLWRFLKPTDVGV